MYHQACTLKCTNPSMQLLWHSRNSRHPSNATRWAHALFMLHIKSFTCSCGFAAAAVQKALAMITHTRTHCSHFFSTRCIDYCICCLVQVCAIDAKAYHRLSRNAIHMTDETWLDRLVVPLNKEVCCIARCASGHGANKACQAAV